VTLRVLVIVLVMILPVHAQLLAVLDKSTPKDAGLSQGQLNSLAQVARGEARRRLPESLQVMSEENTVTILRDMGVNLAQCQGDCEVETGRKLGADWVMSLHVVRFGSSWTLQLNLFETATGALKGSEKAQVSREDDLVPIATEKAGLLAVQVGSRGDGMALGRRGSTPEAWDPGALVGVMVNFASDPPGAAISLDGSYLGDTPLSREVPPGPHRLEWSLPRYERVAETIQIDERTTLNRVLTPLFGWLSVESTPAGQPVQLDGSPAGTTPVHELILGHGVHDIWVGDSSQVYAQGERFLLERGERKSLDYTLPLREGALVVRCTDPEGNAVDRTVSVDGVVRGSSPLQLKLPVGEHVVEVDGHKQTVILAERQVERLDMTVKAVLDTNSGPSNRTGHGASDARPFAKIVGPLPGMDFIVVPSGTFRMGSPKGEADRSAEEKIHEVGLASFAVMTTEVTQAQWERVMGGNPSRFLGGKRPVEQVSWHDVQLFLGRLNRLDSGKGYRLPTEAEWEYACRAGSSTRFHCGDSRKELSQYAWFAANAQGGTHEVATLRPNAWGLFDMHGNVWEWCQDWYGPYAGVPERNPLGPFGGTERIRRGGGWRLGAWNCRAALRESSPPDYSHDVLGFRVVCNAP